MLVHEPLLRFAHSAPDRVAIISDATPVTYAELAQGIHALSGRLRGRLQPGDRALILLADKRKYLTAFFSLSRIGGIAVPLPDGISPTSLREISAHCLPEAMITTGKDLRRVLGSDGEVGCPVVEIDGDLPSPGTATGRVGAEPASDTSEDAIALILYTSGTTGKQKGVLLSHGNLGQAVQNINTFMRIDSTIRECVTVPLTHSFGLGRARSILAVGGTLVVRTGAFNPAAMLHDLSRLDCNALSWVPAGFALTAGRFTRELETLGHQIRWMELGSAALPPPLKLELARLFPEARICMHYGLTEASRSTFLEFGEDRHKLSSVGRPSPNVEIRILDDGGPPTPPGVEGEVCVGGAHVARGYWRDDALNAASFTGEGFLRTGDYGYVDEDAYLHLIGRRDDLINVGGVKVAPTEVEDAVRRLHPELDFCVVGVPDPEDISGSVPALCYAGPELDELSLPKLQKALGPLLDRTKLPKAVRRLGSLPRTENGKIRRREVQRQLSEETP